MRSALSYLRQMAAEEKTTAPKAPGSTNAGRPVSFIVSENGPLQGLLDDVETWPADLREEWEERAAILEEGGLARAEAERAAREDIKSLYGTKGNL